MKKYKKPEAEFVKIDKEILTAPCTTSCEPCNYKQDGKCYKGSEECPYASSGTCPLK